MGKKIRKVKPESGVSSAFVDVDGGLSDHKPSLKTEDAGTLIAQFKAMVEILEASVVRYKATKKKLKTAIYDGQILYWEHQVSTLRWIIGLMLQANG